MTRPDQDAGHRQAAVATGADDIDRPVLGKLRQARRKLAHRHEGGAGDVAAHVLAGLADVDDERGVAVGCGKCRQRDFMHVVSFGQ